MHAQVNFRAPLAPFPPSVGTRDGACACKLTPENRKIGADLEQRVSDAPDVGSLGGRLAKQNLWRSAVVMEKFNIFLAYFEYIEVAEHHFSGMGIQHDVAKLDVSVDQLVAVRDLQGFQKVSGKYSYCFLWDSLKRLLDFCQRTPADILHENVHVCLGRREWV